MKNKIKNKSSKNKSSKSKSSKSISLLSSTKTKNKTKTHTHKHKTPSSSNACDIYKYDINGKLNKQLYNSCKVNKYCRKTKCKNIDFKLHKLKHKKFGDNYSNMIAEFINKSCPLNNTNNNKNTNTKNNVFNNTNNINNTNKKQLQCETKAIKKFYKEHNLDNVYKQVVECDKHICKKEKKIFNNNLFRNKIIKLHKKEKAIIDAQNFDEQPDLDIKMF